jgi:hypothetical protein
MRPYIEVLATISSRSTFPCPESFTESFMATWHKEGAVGGFAYPSIVELCLQADIFALLLVLRPQYLQLLGLQRAFDISGI